MSGEGKGSEGKLRSFIKEANAIRRKGIEGERGRDVKGEAFQRRGLVSEKKRYVQRKLQKGGLNIKPYELAGKHPTYSEKSSSPAKKNTPPGSREARGEGCSSLHDRAEYVGEGPS